MNVPVQTGVFDVSGSQTAAEANGDRKPLSIVQLVLSLLVFALELCGYVYKLFNRFLVHPPLPFFNSLLYNLELLLEMSNTFLAVSVWRRTPHRFELALGLITSQFRDSHPSDRQWVARWFQRLTVLATITVLVATVVDFLSWQNVAMSIASIFTVHVPILITMLVLVQHWYVVSFALRFCRRINRILEKVPGDRSQGRHGRRTGTLESLRKQHKILHELVLHANEGFGMLVLCTLTAVVVVLNVECLNLYQYFRRGAMSISDYAHIVYAVLWLLLHLTLLLMIVYPCHWMNHERHRTGIILFEMLGKVSETDSDEVLYFAQQILNQKERYKACGIITLDLSLIATLVGAVCTNLVIMIKFASD